MDVSVKHRECEKERPNEIVLVLVEHFGEHTLPVEDHGDDVRCRERHPDAPCKIVNTVHRRVPLMLQALHPHHHRHRQRQSEEKNSKAGKKSHVISRLGGAGLILL